MSGPVGTVDAPPAQAGASAVEPACLEVTAARVATVGRMPVRRALPRRERRTVGAWCFADHMGPAPVTETSGLDIGPHPHTGLQTVTWLLAGEVLHRDSLGTEQLIRAGQLNLMTAGHGVAHSEEATGAYRGQLHGVQLWIAQPERTRHGAAAFEHHPELPVAELDNAAATVLVGGFAGATSPARHDTPLVGVEGTLRPGRSAWPLERDFEYALVVLDGQALVKDTPVRPGQLAYLGRGRDRLELAAEDPARVLLLGGEPFDEPILMWWNFVARTREEIVAAATAWRAEDPRFGHVGSPLARLRLPPLPWPRTPRG
jgi:redox-sensitive bicupin YhaK (pirin superfamily)